MATFALIHGGGGSAWDWHLVVPELQERGQQVVAVDLPSDDESAGWWDYADAVVDAIGYRSDLVVVGHSLGGFTAPLVCARVPVDLVVLLAAMIGGAEHSSWRYGRQVLMAEEFLLLCFDGQTGKKIISSDKIEPALGGALLVELALKERIGVTAESAGWRQRRRLTITDTTPTDDLELDSALAKLQAAEGKKIKDLISKLSGKRITKGLERRLLERLAAAGVLRLERGKVLGIFPRTMWPTSDMGPQADVRERLHTALIAGLTPTERTVALIGLLEATGLLTKAVPSEDKKSLRRRAKELTEGDWAARAVKQAIAEVEGS